MSSVPLSRPSPESSVVEVYCPSCGRPQSVCLSLGLGPRLRFVCWLCGHIFACEPLLLWRLLADDPSVPAPVVGTSSLESSRRLVYVAHPLARDVPGNLAAARAICAQIALAYPDVVPVSPLLLNSYLREPEDRDRALAYCLAVLPVCHELWLTGDWPSSAGCRLELDYARRLGMPVYAVAPDSAGRLVPSPLLPVQPGEDAASPGASPAQVLGAALQPPGDVG